MINLLIVLAGLVILGLSLGLGIVLPISRATAGRRDGQPVPSVSSKGSSGLSSAS